MQLALTKALPAMPVELKSLFAEAPLVGNERLKDYTAFFMSIADRIDPADPIEWLYVKDVVDLCWLIKRERSVHACIIKAAEKDVVLELLKQTHEKPGSVENDLFRIFEAADLAKRWSVDPAVRKEVGKFLADQGYGPKEITAKAYQKAAADIDDCEKRIEGYERRRSAIFRDLSFWRQAFAKKLEQASSDIIDAEFSEAA
jgi:hypothetical protein